VCWVEWEAFLLDRLVQEMEAGLIHPAPVWSDVRTFDGRPWRGVVDILLAGYPCQPFSVAGRRRGHTDHRHLWPSIFRITREMEPPVLFFENVPGHISMGLREVTEGLEGLGYTLAVDLFTAEEVRSTQSRERLFILAVKKEVAHAHRSRFQGTEWNRALQKGKRPSIKSPQGSHRSTAKLRSPLFPPPPSELQWWETACSTRSAPLPFESGFRRVVDGVARNRQRLLTMYGNGVIPLVAAYAFCTLWSVIRLDGLIDDD
jgi:DNA (cytosine-5)-methyltransferase 1